MTPEEFAQRLEQVKTIIISNRQNDCLKIAADLKALIQLRIQTGGNDSQGQRFAPYTSAYAKYGRNAQGYQSEYFDFTRTGRAFSNISPVVTDQSKNITIVQVTGRSNETLLKLAGQVKKRGNILTPSQSEIDITNKANAQRILKYIK
jgi:hypothetical protein